MIKGLVIVIFALSAAADCKNIDGIDKYPDHLSALNQKIEGAMASYHHEIRRLQQEITEMKHSTKCRVEHEIIHETVTEEHNQKRKLDWTGSAIFELRVELKELSKKLDGSAMLPQIHFLTNKVDRAAADISDVLQLYRQHEARIDKADGIIERLKYEKQEMQTQIESLHRNIAQLNMEIKHKDIADHSIIEDIDTSKGRDGAGRLVPERNHKYRHNKMLHAQISRLAHAQTQMDVQQENIRTQMLDQKRRLDRLEEPNWNLLSAKIDLLELQSKILSGRLDNNTITISDFDKVHSSMLELREDVESLENKIDKTIPEFRKEISKLDVSVAQINAHFSYVKEDQENLRQSVKAIAVSVSNMVDRTDEDHKEIKKIADTVNQLEKRAKEHSYRLQDHILKSETNRGLQENNTTETIPLPELMGEVKELEPVKREYEDLVKQLPKDCSSISGPVGTYLIRPGRAPLDAWCNNGSTLAQRRYNGSVEFNRKFNEYEHGFGNTLSEYWIGLETMNELTADNCTSMAIDMTDIYGSSWYAVYDHFFVGNADSGYELIVSGFKGNASDAFAYQNHMEFSAIDRDRDISNTHCAANYEGGWWFSHCQHVNINGKYSLGLTWFDSVRNEWIAIATTEMRLYRRPGCI